ncbi:RICIN domain-containing protein [Streptomyces nojiriensis]|uniref:RICIN domain-containing protein n=1 Tax=Streptomyces nojiriensis TaxID=66374 RepID=UPI0036DBAD5E
MTKRAATLSGALIAAVGLTIMPTTSASAADETPIGRYNMGTRKCLEVADWSTANGAAVRQWDCTKGANQKWYVQGGLLRNAHSGKCAEVADWSTSPGAVIRQWDCHGGANQQWIARNGESWDLYYTNQHSGLQLEIGGFSTANGTQATQWPMNWGANQRWTWDF